MYSLGDAKGSNLLTLKMDMNSSVKKAGLQAPTITTSNRLSQSCPRSSPLPFKRNT